MLKQVICQAEFSQETGEKVDVKCVEPPPGLHQIELRNFIANIDILKIINLLYLKYSLRWLF